MYLSLIFAILGLQLAAVCALPAARALPAAQPTPSVHIQQGAAYGSLVNNGTVSRYLGIPYARPPVGELRWKSPQPPSPFNSTFAATSFGSSCWNDTVGLEIPGPASSEDCLSINVWSKATEQPTKLPVMVWIYGGGFEFGTSAQPQYDGALLAQKGVVLVSFNYRVGVLGFLAHPELDKEHRNSGDFGIQDMQAALRWVKQNVAAFGGDPENVTVFGESAGAHAIGILMASPFSQGLFHRAIMESGAWWDRVHGSLTNFTEARQKGIAIAKQFNASSIADLRRVSAHDLVRATPYNLSWQDPGVTNFAPSVDSYVLPATPGHIFHAKQQMKIPLLAGFNGREDSLFQGLALPHANASQFDASARILFAPRLDKFRALYPANGSAETLQNSSDMLTGDYMIREQTWEAADTQYVAGVEAVYVYYYTYRSAYSPIDSHTAEINFVFGALDTSIVGPSMPAAASSQDRDFSDKVMSYWINFARSGDPNGEQGFSNGRVQLPRWPKYQGRADNFMQLGNEIKPTNYSLDRFRFIESFRADGTLPYSWRNAPSAGAP